MAIREILVIVTITTREKDARNPEIIGLIDNAIAAIKLEIFLSF